MSDTRPPSRGEHREALVWYGSLLGLLVPVLVLAFGASAAANRLVFAGWGILMTPLLVVALRRGFEAWRGWPGVVVRVAPVLAVGLALFAVLVGRHREILDLGVRALLPGLYAPPITRPESWWALAALVALLALVAMVAGHGRRSRKRRRGARARTAAR